MDNQEVCDTTNSVTKYPEVEVKTLQRLEEELNKLNNLWIFRGHEEAEWKLLSSYDRAREDLFKLSDSYRDDFQPRLYIRECDGIQYAKELLHKKDFSNIEMLAYLQHYGAPTRLLDFTFSFYVAFAFAFERKVRKTRAVFAINLKKMMQQYQFSEEEKKSMENSEETGNCEADYDEGFYGEDVVAERWRFVPYNPRYIQKFRSRANEYIKDFTIKDFNKIPATVIPYFANTNNPRIVAQNGLFLFPTKLECTFEVNLSSYLEKNKNEDLVKKIVFHVDCNDWAYDLLRKLNLSSRVLYPDLQGLIRSISLL